MSMIIANAIMDKIVQQGWEIDRIIRYVATRMYGTAVGSKQASVRLSFDKEFHQYWLRAEYWSEGRNALSTCFATIPVDAADALIDAELRKFFKQVNDTVSQTYAARLQARGIKEAA